MRTIGLLAGAGLIAALLFFLLPMQGGGGPCQPLTTVCLKATALESIYDETEAEDAPSRYGNHANRLLKWRPHLTADEWEAALAAMQEAGAHGDRFWDPIKRDDAERAAAASLNFDGIRTAVEERSWPKQTEWKTFIRNAVSATLAGPDAGKLADLWADNLAFFDKYAKRPGRAIRDWVILNRFDDAMGLAATPEGVGWMSAGLKTFVYAAEEACRAGETSLSKRIRELHAALAEGQVYEPKLGFLPLTQTFPAVLACDGEDVALARLAKIKAGIDALPKGTVIEHRGLTFSVDRWRADEMSDEVYWPLVVHYLDLGQDETALGYYIEANGHQKVIAGKADGALLTVADIGSPLAEEVLGDQDALREKWYPVMAEEMHDMMFVRQSYLAEERGPGALLQFYVASFDPPFKICCTDQQTLYDMLELVASERGGTDPGAAIGRALELSERAVASGKATGIQMPTVKLMLARAEKALGCEFADGLIGSWLSEIADYRYEDSRQLALLEAYQLMTMPQGTGSGYTCQLT